MVSISSKRSLSVFSLVMINIIAIDSLRNLPVNAVSGFTIPFYYVAACLFFLIPCALVTAELATHFPKTGGAYVWVRNAFGERVGFMAIWLQWIYNVFWYPTILAFVAANIAYFIDPNLVNNKTYMISMIIGLFLIATFLNSFGMKTSSAVSIFSAIVGTIIPMVIIIFLALAWVLQHKPLAITPSWGSFIPNLSQSNNLAFIVVILFSVFGLEMSATHAESVKHPEKDYPKALLYSSIFIALSLIFASLAIAFIVPPQMLNIITGLNQAFALFLAAKHLSFLLPFLILAIIIGAFGIMAAWVIGPTKGMMVAAEDGALPTLFSRRNRFDSPIQILLLQALMVILICSLFVFIKSFNTSYWILSALTAQLAILFYVLFFAAAFRLHKKLKPNPHAFTLKRWVMWLSCLLGILSCLFALIVGFIPPTSIEIHNVYAYEAILIGGVVIFTILPLFIKRRKKNTIGSEI
ncbi:MAG: transporter [Coxiella sp. RIFCSPHIGHO2_12_FULL_42_15]|nr:MAG: transporter [Coxiella sp. RIFCSPHIGHO2_12_FULL_42_15]